MKLSHIDNDGRPKMVDVGSKPATARRAVAEGRIRLSPEAFEALAGNINPKGDVLSIAELAGTTGAKRTADLIPLCHPIVLDHVEVSATPDPALPGVHVVASASSVGRTGVEMEALTAVTVALLTVYDMVKAVGHDLEVQDVRLLEKSGGTSGLWKRNE
jgi:cyclic pyranopterin phosphate synthase